MSGHDEHNGCEERHDDLAAYALGALEDGDAAELERHLASCSTCSERLLWLRPAADLLPASVQQHQPPPSLKRELMATVRAEAPAEFAPEPEAPAREPGLLARIRRGLLGDGPLRPALAGVAVLCLVVAGVLGYALGGDEDPGNTSELYTVLPNSPQADSHGTVEVADGRATLVVQGLRKTPRDEVYQVWMGHEDGTIEPSSTFVVDSLGNGSAQMGPVAGSVEQVMVTREPVGGSTEPHSAPVLSGEL